MRYLFVDIQVNHAYKCEIVEVATVMTDYENINNKFSRLVKPDHLDMVSNKQLKKMGINIKILAKQNNIIETMKTFCQTNKKFDIIVMWDKKLYDIFMSKLEYYDISISNHKFISLKELIRDVDTYSYDSMNIRDASFIYDIGKITSIERSKYNVQNIVEMFDILRKQYLNKYERGRISNFRKLKKSNIIHSLNCFYIRDKDNIEMASLSQLFDGKKLCKYCVRKNRFPMLPMRDISHRNFIDSILKMCSQYKMTANFDDANGIVIINSGIAYWKIYHIHGTIINIYHENYHIVKKKNCKNKRIKWDNGFHIQKVNIDNFEDALLYIHNHDKNFGKKLK